MGIERFIKRRTLLKRKSKGRKEVFYVNKVIFSYKLTFKDT